MIGALACDISGTIIDTNQCLIKWLGYASRNVLVGRCLWLDVLASRRDWLAWKKVGGDTTAFLHQDTRLVTQNGQILTAAAEVFAAPSFPSHLQAVFSTHFVTPS